MKKLILFAIVLMFIISCTGQTIKTDPINQQDYLVLLKDSVEKQSSKIDSLTFQVSQSEKKEVCLKNIIIEYGKQITRKDSTIQSLNEKVMKEGQFIEIYKYKRLEKYYLLCKKRPEYWKYFKGWSIRVFELQNKKYIPTDSLPDIDQLLKKYR